MKTHHRKKFTIVELLVALSIFMMVMAGVMPMYIQAMRQIFTTDAKLNVNDSVRKVMDRIIQEARASDGFILYDSFLGYVPAGGGPLLDMRSATPGMGRLSSARTGKFILFLSYGPDANPNDTIPPPLVRMTGVYFDANEDETSGNIRWFTRTNFGTGTDPLETYIPLAGTFRTNPVLVDSIRGLMNGDIFYNFNSSSVLINARLAGQSGAMRETTLYNFSITPI
jgi:type II secretory pathway pseudopilin PulG